MDVKDKAARLDAELTEAEGKREEKISEVQRLLMFSENGSHVTVSSEIVDEDQHSSHDTVSYACGGGIWRQKWMRSCQSCLS